MNENIITVKDLRVAFQTDRGELVAIDGVSFDVPKGRTVGIVGESGCGKSVTCMSLIDLLPKPMGKVIGGLVEFLGEELTQLTDKRLREIRGNDIGVIFQEPMTALNPVHTIGKQIGESLMLHKGLSKREALVEAVELLKKVGIPAPEQRAVEFPHQLSGGMRQRVVIAIALACQPKLLIADEPTTALDVTVQAQILDLLSDLQKELGMSIILITHDLGVIAQVCDEVIVMYAGRVVEQAPVHTLFANPQHAYTQGLLASIPSLEHPRKSTLKTIEGQVAGISDFVTGCRFCQRMGVPLEELHTKPELVEIAPDHKVSNCEKCNASYKPE
ncbi:ABC transporter ATP-binding protein [Akkermansiaceae bacterium]|nr:ABC transporter ATP-binding protein [Akkermansiaceae bacterium]